MLKNLTLLFTLAVPQYVYRAGTITHLRISEGDTYVTLLDPLTTTETEYTYCGDQSVRFDKVEAPGVVVLLSPARRTRIHCWDLGAILEVKGVQ